MNKITKLIAGLLLLAAALIGVYALMLARQPAPPAAVAPVAAASAPVVTNPYAVVVATKALPAGKPIPADSVRIEQFPIKPAGSFTETSEVAGKTPVVDIAEGVPLVQTHLSGGLAGQVGEGERAVAVNVDESVSVGYRVRPGDFVDVFFVLRQDNAEITPSQGRMLLSKIRVLAMGGSSVNEDNPKADPNQAQAPRTAVLAVPLADVNKVTLAQQAGKLVLALRNPKDPGVPTESLFPAAAAVLQARDFKPGTVDSVSGKTLTKTLATEPENVAYAGTSLPGLAGNKDARRASGGSGAPRTSPPADTVEIIRGGVRQ